MYLGPPIIIGMIIIIWVCKQLTDHTVCGNILNEPVNTCEICLPAQHVRTDLGTVSGAYETHNYWGG